MSTLVPHTGVRSALNRVANYQRRPAREHLGLAAFREDRPGRGDGSWLAAKYHKGFAEHIAKFDAKKEPLNMREFGQTVIDGLQEEDARNWLRLRRHLR